jgi:hypothetical protein
MRVSHELHMNARSRSHARLLRALTAAGLATGLLVLPACMSRETREQMAAGDSILAPAFKQFTPADAAAWAADPYDADKRARGMSMLANAPFGGAEAYVKMYRERLKDDNAPVRATACRALGLHGDAEDVPRIVPLTKSEDILVRLEATRSLQRLHNPAAIPALIERVTIEKQVVVDGRITTVAVESEPEIRAEAASALGQYADGRVVQTLIMALADPSLLVNKNALDSLRTLTGNDDLPADRKIWFEWAKANAKPFANRRPYVYPVFWREKGWLDYVPFMPAVPNETASTPVGFSLEETTPVAEKKP